ncbi:MAG: anti-sigma factor [Proteobacteria bacterium]|nr:anti-sigma factor [Pseudomonadota bacterium]MDA0993076.1 anti-sigma factor [Pseudomonadota bacterium]
MIEETTSTQHEQVSLLLPWFVNNTLDDMEREIVQNHIDECSECEKDVALYSSLRSAVTRSSPTPILPNANLTRLLDSIDGAKVFPSTRRIPRFRITLVASLTATLVVTALTLIYQARTQPVPTRFQTATSAVPVAAMDYVLNVHFAAGTEAADRDKVWREIDARSITPGDAEGLYQVTVKLRVSTLEELEQYTRDVQSLTSVQSIEVVAMQLPLKPSM